LQSLHQPQTDHCFQQHQQQQCQQGPKLRLSAADVGAGICQLWPLLDVSWLEASQQRLLAQLQHLNGKLLVSASQAESASLPADTVRSTAYVARKVQPKGLQKALA